MRRRILLTVVSVTTLVVVCFFVPAALAVRSGIRRGDLLALQHQLSVVTARVPAGGHPDLDTLRPAVTGGRQLALYDETGARLDGVGPDRADAVVTEALHGTLTEGYVSGDLVAAAPVPMSSDATGDVLRLLEPRSVSAGRIRHALVLLGSEAALAVLGAVVIGAVLARRLTRPLDHLRSRVASLGDTDVTIQHTPTGVAEVDQLGTTLEHASARIEELLRRERAFSSHVSHQLRTPVAALRVAVEAELAAPRPDPTIVLTESLDALDRLEDTVTSLLALARHDEEHDARSDVPAIVREELDRWLSSPMSTGRAATLDIRCGPGAEARIAPAALRHVIDVLLDNTSRHGQGDLTLTVDREDDAVTVRVAEEGCLPATADPLATVGSDEGHGIGLRLARTLAAAAGGRLELAARTPTTFALVLRATTRTNR